ncbi:DUF1957 domain-containing protein [bacterium CPR1]|nr:DUF1957 domain-containing protein [bacterium CPR1]
MTGYLILLLDAHLPWVRHRGEVPRPLEEFWLFDVITESYLPLLGMMTGLVEEGIPFRLTVSLSPTLLAMLEDEYLRQAYQEHLHHRLVLAEQELSRTRKYEPHCHPSAEMYYHRLRWVHDLYVDVFGQNLIGAFDRLRKVGALELITTAATHAYLPLVAHRPEMARAQMRVAQGEFRRHFGLEPPGWWLPECAWSSDVDAALEGQGYFFLDALGLMGAEPRPQACHYAPIQTPSGWTVLGRDPECHRQVWSPEGYPSDPLYREFYRDIGWDLPLEYIGPWIHGSGQRMNTGFKYWRITGPTDHKEPYLPWQGRQRAWEHAGSFLESRQRQAQWLCEQMGRPPVVVAPYSAELLGHRWFEGPFWLEGLLRQLASQDLIQLEHPSQLPGPFQVTTPAVSSWSEGGFHQAWLDESTDWVYRHLHQAAERFLEVRQAQHQRALRQAARELLLAQSSDWLSLLHAGSHAEYARRRLCEHLGNLAWLCDGLERNQVDDEVLARLEERDCLFPELDPEDFHGGLGSGQEEG